MSSAPSLALRSLLTGVIRETGLQSPTRRLSGATAPVRALAIAAAAKRLSDGTVLLVVPTDAEIESAVGDICFFLGVLEGSADAVVSQQVLPFPSTQVDPYRGFQPHLKVASARARVLHAIGEWDRARGRGVGGCAADESSRAGVRSCCRRARSRPASTSIRTSSPTRW